MAMMSSGSSGSRSYSYTVTETFTLEEAVRKAGQGALGADEVHRQLPNPLQQEAARIAVQKFSRDWSGLSSTQKQDVMRALSEAISQAKEQRDKPLSVLEALRLARDGGVDDLKLFPALPQELQNALDAIAKSLNSSGFKVAPPEIRSRVIARLLELSNQTPVPKESASKKSWWKFW